MIGIRWYVWTFTAFLAGIILIADLGLASTVFPFLRLIPWVDKIGHFLLMGFLSFLLTINLSGQQIHILPLAVPKGIVVALFAVTLEECSQLFFSHRSFSLSDLCYSIAGVIVFGVIASLVVARNKPHAGRLPE